MDGRDEPGQTLEQKIAEQGPNNQRVDPHLIGLAIGDLQQQNRLRKHTHAASKTKSWCSNLLTPDDAINGRLDELGPLYASVAGSGFGNLTGDALEIVTEKSIIELCSTSARYNYQGHFHYDKPKSAGRYTRTQPPKSLGSHTTKKEADFFLFGFDPGIFCVECKNLREWLYPDSSEIKELIFKAAELNALPLLVARRIHYTTISNLLQPAGIISHEAYFQYYPPEAEELAKKVSDKFSLGFTDVRATETPDPRTVKFFRESVPKIATPMAAKWSANRDALVKFATGEMHLAELYNEIGSPAAGNWRDLNAPSS